MIVGRRSISLQGLGATPAAGATPVSVRGDHAQPKSAPRRPIVCRASHEPLPSYVRSPMDRVERHFDDRDRMFPAADLVRLVERHKNDPGNKHILPWMLRLETALEFMVDLDMEASDAVTQNEREAALRGALKNAQGIRQLLDAFDPFLADEPELFEDALQATDAAFDQRIHELGRLARKPPGPRPTPLAAEQAPQGLITGFGSLWARFKGRLKQELERNVELREGPPPIDYVPLVVVKKQLEEHRR